VLVLLKQVETSIIHLIFPHPGKQSRESHAACEAFDHRHHRIDHVAGYLVVLSTIGIQSVHERRDWGHARDYVEGMWLILQQEAPDDYVLATGEAHSVLEFVEEAFACVGQRIEWRGFGLDGVTVALLSK
jgi:hypothetical protein